MLSLTPAQRRGLRAKAHRLHAVVRVGQHGLTTGVLHEIDVNLLAHELIKVRVFDEDRGARAAVLARICAELGAAPVQHIGKLLVIWRPAPRPTRPGRAKLRGKAKSEADRRAKPRLRERPRRAPPRGDSILPLAGAKSKPQARRPREPAARTPARPPPAGGRGRLRSPVPAAGDRRRRRGP